MTPPDDPRIDQISLLLDVRERIVRVETKLDRAPATADEATEALHLARSAAIAIEEVKASLRWAHRTSAAAVLAFLLNALYALITAS